MTPRAREVRGAFVAVLPAVTTTRVAELAELTEPDERRPVVAGQGQQREA